jgi:folylpolyglutamate synthase/dihydropteroate synthase
MDSLQRFVYDKALPLVAERTYRSTARYENVKLPIVTLFAEVDHAKNPKGYQYLANRLRKVADQFKGKLVFNIANKADYSYVLDDYGTYIGSPYMYVCMCAHLLRRRCYIETKKKDLVRHKNEPVFL